MNVPNLAWGGLPQALVHLSRKKARVEWGPSGCNCKVIPNDGDLLTKSRDAIARQIRLLWPYLPDRGQGRSFMRFARRRNQQVRNEYGPGGVAKGVKRDECHDLVRFEATAS